MHNIHELEKQWLIYKIKSFIPHFSIFFLILLSVVIFLNIDTTNFNKKVKIAEIKTPIIKKAMEKEKLITKVDILKVEVKKQDKIPLLKIEHIEEKKIIVLSPSLDFIKKLRNNSTNSYAHSYKRTILRSKPIYQEEETKIEKEEPVVIKQAKTPRKKQIKIMKQEVQADIEHVIKRFKNNNNPALSLFVAKKYYRLGDYKQAYNYSLITNELNNNIDDSWIIFSKSLVKLGKKDKAIKTLRRYIKYSHSYNARSLLDEIISGKFK